MSSSTETPLPFRSWLVSPLMARLISHVEAGELGSVKHLTIARSEPAAKFSFRELLEEAALLATRFAIAAGAVQIDAVRALAEGIERSEHLVAIVRFEGGLTASLEVTCGVQARQWIEIVGTAGSLVADQILTPEKAAKARYWLHQGDRVSGHEFPAAEGRIADGDSGNAALEVRSQAAGLLVAIQRAVVSCGIDGGPVVPLFFHGFS